MRAFRKQLGLTQSQVAERLGVTFVTVSRWENGKECPSRLALKSLRAFAEANPGARYDTAPAERWPVPESVAAGNLAPIGARRPGATGQTQGGNPRKIRPEFPAAARGVGANEILKRSPAFSLLAKGEIAEICRSAPDRRVKAGQSLYCEDEVLEYLYLVAEGRVKVLRHSVSGRDFVLGFYSQGEVFGNVALLSGKPHPASAEAVVDSRVVMIRTDRLRSFIARHPESGSRLLEGMLEVVGMRQLRATRRLADMAVESVDRRVTYTLLTLSLELGGVLPFTRQEIAEMSGASTETTIRFINRLKQEGMVRPGRRKLTIIDQRKLGLSLGDSLPITFAENGENYL